VESTLRLSGGGEGALLEGERGRFAIGAAAMAMVELCKFLVRTAVHRADALTMMRALKLSSFQVQIIVITQATGRWMLHFRQSLPRFYKA
jgi:hypothetical protein